jgi:hypothetical protein
MLIYALGRGLSAEDMPIVRKIVRDAGRQEYRLSALVKGIISSAPFLMRTTGGS